MIEQFLNASVDTAESAEGPERSYLTLPNALSGNMRSGGSWDILHCVPPSARGGR